MAADITLTVDIVPEGDSGRKVTKTIIASADEMQSEFKRAFEKVDAMSWATMNRLAGYIDRNKKKLEALSSVKMAVDPSKVTKGNVAGGVSYKGIGGGDTVRSVGSLRRELDKLFSETRSKQVRQLENAIIGVSRNMKTAGLNAAFMNKNLAGMRGLRSGLLGMDMSKEAAKSNVKTMAQVRSMSAYMRNQWSNDAQYQIALAKNATNSQIRAMRLTASTQIQLSKQTQSRVASTVAAALTRTNRQYTAAARLQTMVTNQAARAQVAAQTAAIRQQARQQAMQAAASRAYVRNMAMQMSGAIGFTIIDIGTKLEQFFGGRRLEGSVAGAFSQITSAIGGVFGQSIGKITGELGKFAGNIMEVLVNLIIFPIKKVGLIASGFVRGLGYSIASSMLAGMVGGFGNPILSLAIAAIVFLASGALQAVISVVMETADEILSILSHMLKSVTALISAGMELVKTLFTSGLQIIGALWKGFWDTFMMISKKAMDMTMAFLSDFLKKAMEGFAAYESLAVKAAKEVADVYGNIAPLVGRLMEKLAWKSGIALPDIGKAAFDVLSAGIRDVGEAYDILNASQKVAVSGMAELSNVTDAIISMWYTYRSSLKNAAEGGDILRASAVLARTEINELAPALKYILPVASRFGMGLQDVMASLTSLTYVMGRGGTSSAARYLARLFESIYNPAAKGSSTLKRLGVDVKALMAAGKKGNFSKVWMDTLTKIGKLPMENFRDLFTTAQARRAAIITRPDMIAKQLTIMKQFPGVIAAQGTAAQMVNNTFEQMIKRLNNFFKSVHTKAGRVIDKLIQWVIWGEKARKVWDGVLNTLTSGRMSVQIGQWIGAIQKQLEPVREMFTNILGGVGKFIKRLAIGDIFNATTLGNVLKLMDSVIGRVVGVMGKIGYKQITAALILAVRVVDWIAGKVDYIFNTLLDNPKKLWTDLKKMLSELYAEVQPIIANLLSYLYNRAMLLIVELGQYFAKHVFKMGNFDTGVLGEILNYVGLTLQAIAWRILKDVGLELIRYLMIAGNVFTNAIKSSLSTFLTVIKTLVGAFYWMKSLFDQPLYAGSTEAGRKKYESTGSWTMATLTDILEKGGMNAAGPLNQLALIASMLMDLCNITILLAACFVEGIGKIISVVEWLVNKISLGAYTGSGMSKAFTDAAEKILKWMQNPESIKEMMKKGWVGKNPISKTFESHIPKDQNPVWDAAKAALEPTSPQDIEIQIDRWAAAITRQQAKVSESLRKSSIALTTKLNELQKALVEQLSAINTNLQAFLTKQWGSAMTEAGGGTRAKAREQMDILQEWFNTRFTDKSGGGAGSYSGQLSSTLSDIWRSQMAQFRAALRAAQTPEQVMDIRRQMQEFAEAFGANTQQFLGPEGKKRFGDLSMNDLGEVIKEAIKKGYESVKPPTTAVTVTSDGKTVTVGNSPPVANAQRPNAYSTP